MLTAKDVMTTTPVAIGPDRTAGEALDLLVHNEISGLPVTDPQGRLLGILTEYALVAIVYDPTVASDPVSKHMTKDIVSVGPDATLQRIADLLVMHRIRRLPVVDQGKLVGLISRRDVLRAAREADGQPLAAHSFENRLAARMVGSARD
jgi:CBS domain-containing protein